MSTSHILQRILFTACVAVLSGCLKKEGQISGGAIACWEADRAAKMIVMLSNGFDGVIGGCVILPYDRSYSVTVKNTSTVQGSMRLTIVGHRGSETETRSAPVKITAWETDDGKHHMYSPAAQIAEKGKSVYPYAAFASGIFGGALGFSNLADVKKNRARDKLGQRVRLAGTPVQVLGIADCGGDVCVRWKKGDEGPYWSTFDSLFHTAESRATFLSFGTDKGSDVPVQTERFITLGSPVCASVESMFKAEVIFRSGNRYAQLPSDCAMVDKRLKIVDATMIGDTPFARVRTVGGHSVYALADNIN